MVFANTWSIHQDETEHVNPKEFIPERFLESRFGSIRQDDHEDNESRRTTYGFGAGRRVCAGQRLAENSLVNY
jgi:cytochrome P450